MKPYSFSNFSFFEHDLIQTRMRIWVIPFFLSQLFSYFICNQNVLVTSSADINPSLGEKFCLGTKTPCKTPKLLRSRLKGVSHPKGLPPTFGLSGVSLVPVPSQNFKPLGFGSPPSQKVYCRLLNRATTKRKGCGEKNEREKTREIST